MRPLHTDAVPSSLRKPPPVFETAFVLDADPELIDGSPVKTFDVRIENRTAETVRFGSMSCACSCSASTRDKDQLEPGEATTAHMTVGTAGRSGKQRFLCQWSDDAQRQWSALVRVELLGSEQFEPVALSLGNVLPETRVRRTANLVQTWRAGTPAPSQPLLQPTDRNVQVSFGEPEQVSLGGTLLRRITPATIELQTHREAGHDSTKVLTTTVPTLLQPSAQLSIDWNVKAPIVAVPARIVFNGNDLERTIRVESADGKPLPVVAVHCDHPGIAVKASAPQSNQIVVTRLPGVESKTSFAEIAVETGNSSRVTVAVVLPPAVRAPQ